MMQMATIEQVAAAAGYHAHERARESWAAVFEMLVLQRRFAGLTDTQTVRNGLDVIGDEEPAAVLSRCDHAIEHLRCFIELLELGRDRLDLAVSGAVRTT